MSMIKTLLVTTVTVLTIALPTQGFAKGGNKFKELDLSPEQSVQFKEIRAKHKAKIDEHDSAIEAARNDLKTSMQAPKKGADYKKELLEKYNKLSALKEEVHRKKFEMALDIREILTDEQIAKFKGMSGHEGKKYKRHKKNKDSASDNY